MALKSVLFALTAYYVILTHLVYRVKVQRNIMTESASTEFHIALIETERGF